ncbi:50S ribosomal protein L5 [Candidatus Pacearchaeota archaeon]|nr:50S ribosomal protein L5 [Candidatus Pacearchaeota archaeon]
MKQRLSTIAENPMRKIKLEKVVLSCSGKAEDLEKSKKLLEMLSGRKAHLIKAGPNQRIPSFGVRPGLEIGTRVTLRGKGAIELLRRLLGTLDNTLRKRQISENNFSFGIKEYIEIPGTEYKREIGIRGLNVTVVFSRAGARVKRKKLKSGKIPDRQHVQKEEIINFMKENFSTEVR